MKISSAKWWLFCLSLNEKVNKALIRQSTNRQSTMTRNIPLYVPAMT